MKKLLQWTALAALALGSAQAADVRLGLNSSASLGCEIAGVRAGVQEGRFGGYLQGAYCTSNVADQPGGAAFGGGVTFDFYQSPSLSAYGLLGASTVPNSNPSVYGGVGARYALPLLPVEAYLEGGIARTSTILGGLTSPRLALGINYVWRGVDLSQLNSGESRPSNISAAGTGGLNADSGTGTGGAAPAPAPASCNVSPEADAAAAQSVARAAAQRALASAATAYSAIYSNVSYDISVGSANINGNSATVTGTINLRATNRTSGEPVGGSYSGVVTLSRSGCSWVATGYRQNGE